MTVPNFMNSKHDPTAREIHELNLLLRAIREINQLIVRERKPDRVLAGACEILVQTRGYPFAWVGLTEPGSDRVVPAAQAGKAAGCLDAINATWGGTPTGQGPVGTAIRTGQPWVCQDTAADPRYAPWREEALERGFASLAAVPMKQGPRTLGALAVYSDRLEAFAEEEVELLNNLAADLAFALQTIEDNDERTRAETALRDTESLYHSLVEHLPQCIFRKDREGRLTYVNSLFCALLGKRPQELLGKTVFDYLPLEMAEKYGQEEQRVLQTKVVSESIEIRMSAANRPTVVHAIKSPVRDASGEIIGVQGILTDITSQKELEEKFLRAQRLESIGSLASGIAHDLNNILAPILMCAPLLREEHSKEGREHLLTLIEASAQRAVNIVKQLLSIGRGNAGLKTALQMRHLLREVAKIARETFPRSIQVKENFASDLWLLIGDATQLHQVLLNLCVNARDAMPAGGTLSLSAENVTLDENSVSTHKDVAAGPFVRIQVQDTGTGIAESAREHIFQSFFTTKGPDQGTGLGLTTVLGIVKDHRGFITYTTAEGKGTTFEIHVPAAPEARCSAESGQALGAVPRGHGELILLVDDEPAIGDAGRRTLERQGYTVLHAKDGIDALAQFASQRSWIRAVVTDFMMPHMDGVTLARTLRRLSPQTPIIVSSGGLLATPAGDPRQSFSALGIRHILEKPHNPQVLLQALDDVLHTTVQPLPEAAGSP
jgi:PAS domain S-box-containing protein